MDIDKLMDHVINVEAQPSGMLIAQQFKVHYLDNVQKVLQMFIRGIVIT